MGCAVSSRGASHAAGRRHSAQLRAQHLRSEAFLDASAFHRCHRGAGKTAGWQRAGDLRAFRRSRFFRCGRAGRSRHARRVGEISAHVRLRQQRRAAQERIRESSEKSARQSWAAPDCGRCHRAFYEKVGGSERSGKEAEDHRQRIHCRLRSRKHAASKRWRARSSGWCRGRFIRT